MHIPNKSELALPFIWKDMRTQRSAQLAEVFLKHTVEDVINSISRPGSRPLFLSNGDRFGMMTVQEKIATLCDAYEICLKDDDHKQLAALAGGIFYFLTIDPKLEKNIESAEVFFENVTLYGYRDMWIKLLEAAHEASEDKHNMSGVNIVTKIRKRGIHELKDKYERVIIDQELRQCEIEKVTTIFGHPECLIIDSIIQVVLGTTAAFATFFVLQLWLIRFC